MTLVAVPDAAQPAGCARPVPPTAARAAVGPTSRARAGRCDHGDFDALRAAPAGRPRRVWAESTRPRRAAARLDGSTLDDEAPDADAVYVLEESADPTGLARTRAVVHAAPRPSAYGDRPRGAPALLPRARGASAASARAPGPAGWPCRGAPVRALGRLAATRATTPGALLDVQRALLRMCAARGDLLAVLSLPEHYREDEAIGARAHAAERRPPAPGASTPCRRSAAGDAGARLRRALPPVAASPRGADAGQRVRRTPPDGAVAGVHRRARAAHAGAWVAPPNEPLRDVVALDPRRSRGALARLLQDGAGQRRAPGAARLPLRSPRTRSPPTRDCGRSTSAGCSRCCAGWRCCEGASYVFEPNDAVLRRAVQRGFEALLRPAVRARRVRRATARRGLPRRDGDPPNTRSQRRRGPPRRRAAVAPSLPLTFLTRAARARAATAASGWWRSADGHADDGRRPPVHRVQLRRRDLRSTDGAPRVCSAAFAECDGLEMTMDVKTIREGGNNGRAASARRARRLRQLTLKRGHDRELRPLGLVRAAIAATPSLRADGEVVLLAAGRRDRAGALRAAALPAVKLKAPPLNAKDGMVAIEELQLAYESLTLKRPGGGSRCLSRASSSAPSCASSTPTSARRSTTTRTVKVQFNPETLKVTFANQIVQSRGRRRPARHARRASSSAPARPSSRCSCGST